MLQLISCRTWTPGFALATAVSVIATAAMLVACSATGTQAPLQTTPPSKGASTTASEINNALAIIAGKASLPLTDYQIGPEDLLQITLFNVSPSNEGVTPRTVSVRVSQHGLLSLPLVGTIKASGMTTAMLERDLQKRYDQYIHNPYVGISIAEYRQRVSVIGAVLKPGVIDLTAPKTVFDILAMAGGVTEKAGTQVHIYRQGPNGRESEVIDLLALASNASIISANGASVINVPVQGGDIINVPPAGMFYVDGAVGRPGSYPLGRHYSLTQALAVAGGINRDLNSADITIFRRKASLGIQPITADLDAILANAAEDPKIEEDDYILVPINSLKYVYHRIFGQILGWGISLAGVAATSGS